MVWSAPLETTNLIVTSVSPATANLSWDAQDVSAGPGTTYDLVSGTLGPGPGVNFAGASCRQSAGPASYSDGNPDPAIGFGYWYLSRARNGCGVGTYGTSARDTTIPPCP
jgi:hypothetical protein